MAGFPENTSSTDIVPVAPSPPVAEDNQGMVSEIFDGLGLENYSDLRVLSVKDFLLHYPYSFMALSYLTASDPSTHHEKMVLNYVLASNLDFIVRTQEPEYVRRLFSVSGSVELIENINSSIELEGSPIECYQNYSIAFEDIFGSVLTRLREKDGMSFFLSSQNETQVRPFKIFLSGKMSLKLQSNERSSLFSILKEQVGYLFQTYRDDSISRHALESRRELILTGIAELVTLNEPVVLSLFQSALSESCQSDSDSVIATSLFLSCYSKTVPPSTLARVIQASSQDCLYYGIEKFQISIVKLGDFVRELFEECYRESCWWDCEQNWDDNQLREMNARYHSAFLNKDGARSLPLSLGFVREHLDKRTHSIDFSKKILTTLKDPILQMIGCLAYLSIAPLLPAVPAVAVLGQVSIATRGLVGLGLTALGGVYSVGTASLPYGGLGSLLECQSFQMKLLRQVHNPQIIFSKTFCRFMGKSAQYFSKLSAIEFVNHIIGELRFQIYNHGLESRFSESMISRLLEKYQEVKTASLIFSELKSYKEASALVEEGCCSSRQLCFSKRGTCIVQCSALEKIAAEQREKNRRVRVILKGAKDVLSYRAFIKR